MKQKRETPEGAKKGKMSEGASRAPDPDAAFQEVMQEMMRTSSIFSAAVNMIFTLHDYASGRLIFVSEAYTELTGITQEEIERTEIKIYRDMIHPKDADLVRAAYKKSYELLFKKRKKDSTSFVFTTNFRFRMLGNEYLQVDNYSVPVLKDENEFPRVGANIMRPAKRKGVNRFVVHYPESNLQLYYSRKLGNFVSEQKIELKEIEIEILKLSSEGANELAISRKLNINKNLVNHYKRNIYHKLYVNSMSEAVYTAFIANLI